MRQPVRSAPVRSVPTKVASSSIARLRLAPLRFASLRFAWRRFAPLRLALRFGRSSPALTSLRSARLRPVPNSTRVMSRPGGNSMALLIDMRLARLRSALPRFALPRSARVRSVLLRFALLRFASLRFAWLRFALLRFASLRFAWLRFALLRFASLRFAWLRSALLRFASLRFAKRRSAPSMCAPWRCAPRRSVARRYAPLRFARKRFALRSSAPANSAPLRSAPATQCKPCLRSAPTRLAPLRSGRMSGFSSRHAFQASTPFLSIATCSSFAIEAPLRDSAPVLLGLALHRRRVRVLELQPVLRAARSIARAKPLRDDAFEAHLAGVPEYALAVVGEVPVQTQPRKAPTQQARERRLARLQRLAPQVLAIQLKEVEGIE